MSKPIVECYERAPSASAFMSRAFLPSKGLPADGSFPELTVLWREFRIDPDELQAFRLATGMDARDGAPLLFPHVFGFRLQMALLTHRAYPLPIWTALQIRNRLIRRRELVPGQTYEMETRIGERRIVEKGIEVDLLTRLNRGSDCYWESRIGYFYRGRFGRATPSPSPSPIQAPDLADAAAQYRFVIPGDKRWEFGAMTGDYNGIHQWRWYAKLFGFPAAFSHPQRTAGQCLSRLRAPDAAAQTLDLWIKGPVFYDAAVELNARQDEDGVRFGLSLAGDPRAALIGHWRKGADDR